MTPSGATPGAAWRRQGFGPGTLFKMAAVGWARDKRDCARPPGSKEVCRAREGAAPWHGCRRGVAALRTGNRIARLHRSKVAAEGWWVVPARGACWRIVGASVAGCLVVPVLLLMVAEPTLKFIPPPGAGRSRTRAPRWPGVHRGRLPTVGVAYVSARASGKQYLGRLQATGPLPWCAFWGRVRSVVAELRQRDPSARLVLVLDVGRKPKLGPSPANCNAFVTMPEGWPANADANDLAQRDGFDALEALLLAPKVPGNGSGCWLADLHAPPLLAWCVRGVLPAHGR